MRYYIAAEILWYINAIFSRRGYDRYIDIVFQLIIPGMIYPIIIAMFIHVFVVKYVKNRHVLGIILAILVIISFRLNENYQYQKFLQEDKEFEQLQSIISTVKSALPIRPNSQTILKDIDLYSDKVIYTYLVKGENFTVNEKKFIQSLDESRFVIIQKICSQDITKALFVKRITVEWQYRDNYSKLLYSIKVNPKICFD